MSKWAEARKRKLKMSADNENFNKNLVWSFIRSNSIQLQVIFVFMRSCKCLHDQEVVLSERKGWLGSRLNLSPSDFRNAYYVSRAGPEDGHTRLLNFDFWNPDSSNLNCTFSQNCILLFFWKISSSQPKWNSLNNRKRFVSSTFINLKFSWTRLLDFIGCRLTYIAILLLN